MLWWVSTVHNLFGCKTSALSLGYLFTHNMIRNLITYKQHSNKFIQRNNWIISTHTHVCTTHTNTNTHWYTHINTRRFPKITGEDNLTVFSYSGRVKSPEWRWQWRRADLWHFEIFRHEPIIICTRLPAGGTYYPICTFPASSECLIGISDAFSPFVYGYPPSHPQAWTYMYSSMPEGSYRVQSPGFPKFVY